VEGVEAGCGVGRRCVARQEGLLRRGGRGGGVGEAEPATKVVVGRGRGVKRGIAVEKESTEVGERIKVEGGEQGEKKHEESQKWPDADVGRQVSCTTTATDAIDQLRTTPARGRSKAKRMRELRMRSWVLRPPNFSQPLQSTSRSAISVPFHKGNEKIGTVSATCSDRSHVKKYEWSMCKRQIKRHTQKDTRDACARRRWVKIVLVVVP